MSDPISRKRAADDADEQTPPAPALRGYCPPSLTAMIDAEHSWLNPCINTLLCRDIINVLRDYLAPALYYHVDRYTRHAYEEEFGVFDLASEKWRMVDTDPVRRGLFRECYSIDRSACYSMSDEYDKWHVVTIGDFVRRGRADWSVVVPNVGPRQMAKLVPQRADLVWGIGADYEWIARLGADSPPEQSRRRCLPPDFYHSSRVVATVDSMLCFLKKVVTADRLLLYDAEHGRAESAVGTEHAIHPSMMVSIAPQQILYGCTDGTYMCDFRCARVTCLGHGKNSVTYNFRARAHAVDEHRVLFTNMWGIHGFDLRSPAWKNLGTRRGDLSRYDTPPSFALHH